MARNRQRDFFRNHQFHLIDMPASFDLGEGSPFVLSPVFGFNSITAPSIQVETFTVKPGNQPFPVHIPKSATVDNITLSRGAFIGDDEFYRWIQKAVYNRGSFYRNLLLIQIHQPYLGDDRSAARIGEVLTYGGAALSALAAGGIAGDVGAAALGGAVAAAGGPVIAVRGWLLHHCMPIRYKAASDFDATSADVSLQELEFEIEWLEQMDFGPPVFPIESVGINALGADLGLGG